MKAELWHYGIKGQKKGLRRFQNEDGSYTEEGKRRYGIGEGEGIVSRQPEKKPHPGTKSGPYDTFKYKDPNERMPESAQKIKSMIKEGRETKEQKAEKEKLKADLKKGYSERLGGALTRIVSGWGLMNLGSLVGMTTSHRATGAILNLTGKVLIGSGAFRAAAHTGAYFIGKSMIDEGKLRPEDLKGDKNEK